MRKLMIGLTAGGVAASMFAADLIVPATRDVATLNAYTKNKMATDKEIALFKSGDKTFIRSRFSKDKDIIIIISLGHNRQIDFNITRLVPANLPLIPENFDTGTSIHYCNDDSAPIFINGTYLGGNHGAMAGIEITSENHNFCEKDLGSKLSADNQSFYLARILGPGRFLVIPENTGQDSIWHFKVLSAIKDQLKNESSDQIIKVTKAVPTQLLPGCRITKQEYWLDGKKLADNGNVETGKILEVIEHYDIIPPDLVLEEIKNNPGKEVNFIDKKFAPLVVIENVYKFSADGACIIKQRYKIKRTLAMMGRAGFGLVQTQPLYPGKSFIHEYYIPKTQPFEKFNRKFNFSGIENFGDKLPGPIYFSAAEGNITDQKNLPDRFIQFLSQKDNDKISREIGFALGYSLTECITIPETRSKMTDLAAYIYTTKKSYPIAVCHIRKELLPAGTDFEAVSYRQYFVPEAASQNATSVYWHQSGKAYILYADYHKVVENDTINIPPEWNGRKITVIEKTPAVEITSNLIIDNAKIKVSTQANYGYIVLKVE